MKKNYSKIRSDNSKFVKNFKNQKMCKSNLLSFLNTITYQK